MSSLIVAIISLGIGVYFFNDMFIFSLVFLGLGAFFAYDGYLRIKDNKFVKENTKEIEENIYKGLVISKDKKSNTQSGYNTGVIQTTHHYRTTVRMMCQHSFNVYFNGEDVYLNCFEQEEVAIKAFTYRDSEGNVLREEYEFLGSYAPYEKVLNEH